MDLRLRPAKKVDSHGPERVPVLCSHIGGVHFVQYQRAPQLPLPACVYLPAIQVAAAPPASCQLELQCGAVANRELWLLVQPEGHGDAVVGAAMHKVHGAINGIYDPGGLIGQLPSRRGAGGALLTNVDMIGKLSPQAAHQQILDLTVCDCDQILVTRFGFKDANLSICLVQ